VCSFDDNFSTALTLSNSHLSLCGDEIAVHSMSCARVDDFASGLARALLYSIPSNRTKEVRGERENRAVTPTAYASDRVARFSPTLRRKRPSDLSNAEDLPHANNPIP
jgi:hypothetical protein